MENAPKKPRIDWHNAFSEMIKHRFRPLGLEVSAELPVAKNPMKIDVVVFRKQASLSPKAMAQLPDGVREHLNEFNIIDFKLFYFIKWVR